MVIALKLKINTGCVRPEDVKGGGKEAVFGKQKERGHCTAQTMLAANSLLTTGC